MRNREWSLSSHTVCLLALLAFNAAHAAPLLNEAHVVTANENVAATLPAPISFSVTTASDYTITLTDVGKKANSGAFAFSSLSVVIYQNSQLVKVVTVAELTDNSKVDNVALVQGTYSAQVLGATTGASLYSLSIANPSATLLSTAGSITAASSTTSSDLSSVDQELSLTPGRSYSISAIDIGFPSTLESLNVNVVSDGTNLQCVPPVSATPGPCTFVAGNTNRLLVLAKKSTAAVAGMYSIKLVDNSNSSAVIASVYPIGELPSPVSVSFPANGMYQLITTDIKTPDPLNNLQTMLLQDLEVLANQTASGSSQMSAFTAKSGTAKLYVIAKPSNNGGVYGVQISKGTSVVYSNASVVQPDTTTTQTGYFFNATLPAAGSYTLMLSDLNFPQTFKRLSLAVTQGVATLGTLSTTGAITINATAPGDIQINVIATPNPGGQGLFGLTLTATASSSKLLNLTQGVGATFRTIPVSITTAGSYKLNVVDMQAPGILGQLLVAVTRDTQFLGEVIGSASVNIDATPGDYAINIIASTGPNAPFGMYGVAFSAAPTLTLSASATSVTTGSNVTLTWSSTDLSSCVAADGWSGAKAVSGSESVGPLSSDGKFTLNCVSSTGAISKSVNVTVRPVSAAAQQSSSGRSGGGAMQWWMLGVLFAAAARFRLMRAS